MFSKKKGKTPVHKLSNAEHAFLVYRACPEEQTKRNWGPGSIGTVLGADICATALRSAKSNWSQKRSPVKSARRLGFFCMGQKNVLRHGYVRGEAKSDADFLI
jgi:hypothetical protein